MFRWIQRKDKPAHTISAISPTRSSEVANVLGQDPPTLEVFFRTIELPLRNATKDLCRRRSIKDENSVDDVFSDVLTSIHKSKLRFYLRSRGRLRHYLLGFVEKCIFRYRQRRQRQNRRKTHELSAGLARQTSEPTETDSGLYDRYLAIAAKLETDLLIRIPHPSMRSALQEIGFGKGISISSIVESKAPSGTPLFEIARKHEVSYQSLRQRKCRYQLEVWSDIRELLDGEAKREPDD